MSHSFLSATLVQLVLIKTEDYLGLPVRWPVAEGMDQGRGARRGMVKAHASKQIPRSPGKLGLPTGLDLAERLRQEAGEPVVPG